MVIGRFGQDCAKAGAVAAKSAASAAIIGMMGMVPPEEIGSFRMNLHEMSLLIICISQKPCVGANSAMGSFAKFDLPADGKGGCRVW